MGIKKIADDIKAKIDAGCRRVDKSVEKSTRRVHLLPGDAHLMMEVACMVSGVYSARGYETQRFKFMDGDESGVLVQIKSPDQGWKHRLATVLGGQQIAVNVRFEEKGDSLEVTIDNGRWLDKALSGVLAWAVFAPLLIFPVAGLWRQRQLIEQVERETLEWLAVRHRAGCIDV